MNSSWPAMTRKPIVPRDRDMAACLLFLIFWIAPLCYTGLTNRDVPFAPRTVAYFQRISFLFTDSVPAWPVYYIQAKSARDSDWFELNESDYFQLRPFGYRTRFHQFMIRTYYATGYAKGAERRSAREAELANWIANRYSERYPNRPALVQVRFLEGLVARDAIRIEGHWRTPNFSDFSEDQMKEVSVHNVGK